MTEFSNADIRFTHAFYSPSAAPGSAPKAVRVMLTGKQPQEWSGTTLLRFSELSAKTLQEKFHFLSIDVTQKKAAQFLREQFLEEMQAGTVTIGYYFEETGAVRLPDGTTRFLRGTELLPDKETLTYELASELSGYKLAGNGTTSLQEIVLTLAKAPLQVLLTLAFVILTSVRSTILAAGIDFQAVLYVVGGQGLGKTTLATRLAGIYRDSNSNRPVAVIQAGSSIAAVESLLLTHRDQPVVVDDLCLSAGKETERKRRELGARLIREGAGDIPIVKKVGRMITEFYSHAGVILTAEFSLENMSDLTRCILVPIDQRLNLSDEFTPELVGDIARLYSSWFADNIDSELGQLKELLDSSWGSKLEPRVRKNYVCLRWAFLSLVRLFNAMQPQSDGYKNLVDLLDRSIVMSLDKHKKLCKSLLAQLPVGNLSACILSGYKSGDFDLTKKLGKLPKHDGIMYKDDLCLRPEALVRFVRLQPGFKDWTRNRISRELKDLGPLVLQEESTSTVHLNDDAPRVYRIRLEVLEDSAQYFNN